MRWLALLLLAACVESSIAVGDDSDAGDMQPDTGDVETDAGPDAATDAVVFDAQRTDASEMDVSCPTYPELGCFECETGVCQEVSPEETDGLCPRPVCPEGTEEGFRPPATCDAATGCILGYRSCCPGCDGIPELIARTPAQHEAFLDWCGDAVCCAIAVEDPYALGVPLCTMDSVCRTVEFDPSCSAGDPCTTAWLPGADSRCGDPIPLPAEQAEAVEYVYGPNSCEFLPAVCIAGECGFED